LAGSGVDDVGYGMLTCDPVLVMLEENPDILQPRLPARAPAPCGDNGWCAFQPDSYVTDGVQVERRRVLAGITECSALPFLFVGVQDGRAVKMTTEHAGRKRSRVFVSGDVEIYPAGLSGGITTLERSTDQLQVGIEPRVISNTAEAAGIDSRRVNIVEHFGSQDPTVYHIARRLFREKQTSGLGGRLYTEALVTELVIHLLREYSSAGARENGNSRDIGYNQLRPALEMIHDDLQANPSLSALADAVRLSPHHFSRVFKRVTGLSPHQYVLSQRIQLAQRLLVETKLSIAEVAHDVGFYDQSHFTYHFKRLVGITPSAIRERKNVLPE
jgi:AraC family transcriptional regulator